MSFSLPSRFSCGCSFVLLFPGFFFCFCSVPLLSCQWSRPYRASVSARCARMDGEGRVSLPFFCPARGVFLLYRSTAVAHRVSSMHYRFSATISADDRGSARENGSLSRPRLRLAFSDALSSSITGVWKVADLSRQSLQRLSSSLARATTESWRLNTNTLLLSPGRDADKLHADPPLSPPTFASDNANERRGGRSLAHLSAGFDELFRMLETQDEVVSALDFVAVLPEILIDSALARPGTFRSHQGLRWALSDPDSLCSGQR